MGPWQTLPQQIPTDGEKVWVRINYWFGQPFLAKWDRAEATFTYTGPAWTIVYPAWTVMRWASQ